ncbi:AraC family transcriptional regulator [Holdemanella porci]|uniref:AraC family transcriptional regulator n=1 Tax=Holdemanella porci TaxID=2652276 RepID=UPI0029423CAA|nr:AraC family transcriptional regulator [Holdemanella porci]
MYAIRSTCTNEFPCAAYEINTANNQNHIVDLHWHEEFEIIYCAKGTLNLRILSKTYVIEQDDITILNTNVMHYIICSNDAILQSFVFNSKLITGTSNSSFAKKYIVPLMNCKTFDCYIYHGKYVELFKEAFYSIKDESFDYEFIVRDNLSQILLDLYTQFENKFDSIPSTLNTNTQRIRTMISFIKTNYASPLDVRQISDTVNISQRECLRCFKKTLQISPIQYLIRYRIIKSAELLVDNPTKNIDQIGYECGFETPSYYTQLFKRYYNCTPTEFRNSQKKRA